MNRSRGLDSVNWRNREGWLRILSWKVGSIIMKDTQKRDVDTLFFGRVLRKGLYKFKEGLTLNHLIKSSLVTLNIQSNVCKSKCEL